MPTIEETLDEGLVDLRLDDDNVDDDDREEHPRRLLQVAGVGPGASAASSIVAYGGNFGKVVNVRTRQVVRTTEDAIRAVAVNQSGTRVVLGSDSGDTFIFAYDDDTLEGGAGGEHPFVAMPLSSSSSLKDGEDSEDRFMSQGSEMVVRQGETCWEASRDDDAMRDYAWLNDGTTLLCASEKHWFWLDCSTEASCVTKHFAGELDAAHAGSGIRSVALNENQSALITLDMEGRACWWRPATNNRNNKKGSGGAPEWELLHREATKCVTRKDVGEVFGSSSWCRSSRPHFVTGTVAALPGEPFLQLRRLKLPKGNGNGDGSLEVETFDQVVDEARDGSVQGHVQAIVTMCSRDGYLITAGRDGRVVVWDVQETSTGVTSEFVRVLGEYPSAPTDLMWTIDPSDGEECLHILTAKGQLATIKGRDKIAPLRGGSAGTSKASKRDATKSTAEAAKTKTQGASAQTTKVAAKVAAVDNADSDDDSVLGKSNPGAPTATKSHPSSGAEPSVSHNDDDDDSLFGAPGDEEGTSSPPAKKNRFVDDEAAEDDDDDDDDMGAPKQSRGVTTPPRGHDPSARSPRADDRDDFDNDDDDDDDIDEMPPPHRGHLPPRSAGIVLPEPQAPFAPSSTPLDMARRFLCWNHVGSVTRLISDDGRTVVNIDFTDSAFRRPISFTDNLGFVVGSLGEDGGIFCTDLSGDGDEYDVSPDVDALLDGLSEATRLAVKKSQQSRMRDGGKGKPTGSSIYFHRYEPSVGSTRDKDWHLALPNGERALGCASGEGWAAVMTSRRFLRLFTSGGNQSRVHWLPGEPVTMAGRSRFLVVVYHQSSPLPDATQQLGYMLIDAASDGRILCKGSLSCVSKGSALTWIGLSNDHCAMAMDSDGMVSMLASTGCADAEMDAKSSHWEWMPMLDTVGLRKSVDDNFWPITVYDGKLVCVPLKGGTRHPDAARRPVTTSLNFRLPLARGPLTQTNALEELSVRAGVALNQKRVLHDLTIPGKDQVFENEYLSLSAQVDKVTLKIFAGTVEAGKLERALDLVERLHLEKSYDLAMTIADNHRKLVDRIEEAKERRFGSDFTNDQTDDPDDFDDEDPDVDYESFRITPDSTIGRKRTKIDEPTSAIARMIRRKQGVA